MNIRRIAWVIVSLAAILLAAMLATRLIPFDDQSFRNVVHESSEDSVKVMPSGQAEARADQSLSGSLDGKSIRFNGVGLEIPIRMEEDGVDSGSAELMAEIISDISLIYGELLKYEFIRKSSERLVVIDGRAQNVVKTLLFSGGDVRRPKSHHGEFGLIAQIGGADTLVIPRPLLREYKAAFAFRKANSAMVASAYSLVDVFNEDSANPSSPSRGVDIYWTPGNLNIVIPPRKSETLRRPSLLSFRKASKDEFETFPQLPSESFFADAVLKSSDGRTTDYLPLVWLNGGWRIMLVTPGT